MKTFLYHENGWRMIQAEELPVKPIITDIFKSDMSLANRSRIYESEIAALKAKSIPVGNPDIIAEVINRLSTHGGTVFTLVNGVANVFTEWPGGVEIKEESEYPIDHTSYPPYRQVAILTL